MLALLPLARAAGLTGGLVTIDLATVPTVARFMAATALASGGGSSPSPAGWSATAAS